MFEVYMLEADRTISRQDRRTRSSTPYELRYYFQKDGDIDIFLQTSIQW